MMVAERGASENTVSAYRGDLEEFFYIAEGAGSKGRIRKTSEYLSSCAKKNRSHQSRRLSVLRQFYSFLLAEAFVLMTLPSVSTDPSLVSRCRNIR